MEKLIVRCFISLAFTVSMPVLSALAGAFAGWIVGFFWTAQILDFLSRVGVATSGLTLWEVGAAMGFFGGFLTTSVVNHSDD